MAAGVLRAGGVVIYPTDTIYGLGADAFSDLAVAKVYSIKGREEGKPIHAVFADIAMIERYAEVDDRARALIERFLPGPLTLILKKKKGYDSGIGNGIATVGVRMPQNEFCLALARAFGKPYTTTSANRAGAEPPATLEGIEAQLGESLRMVSLVIDAGALPPSLPSTVLDLTAPEPKILREGAVPSAEILNAIASLR
jgi:L-threonylcarbamoyladenylate synthase